MSDRVDSESERFYRERDCRTEGYLGKFFPAQIPISIHASSDACESHPGQLLLTTLVNQLARIHRSLYISLAQPDARLLSVSLCGGSNLGDELTRLMKRIDPYGTFEVSGPKLAPSKISIGVGAYCGPGLCWYVGWDRSNAELAKSPCRLGHQTSADLRGAGLSALMGAAAAAKEALNIETTPATVSAWNLQSGGDADPGPSELPTINVGRGLMIGAGAGS